jgi:hypothetical protein
MANWNTLHIFGFGDVQVITKDGGATKKASTLTTLQAVIDNVWNKKPADNKIAKEFHAINIFENMFADWQPKEPNVKGFRTSLVDLNTTLIQALVDEVLMVVPPLVVQAVPTIKNKN